jgi:hypothetical protein
MCENGELSQKMKARSTDINRSTAQKVEDFFVSKPDI